MVVVRLLSYVHALIHDSVLHGKIVFCAIECFMEIQSMAHKALCKIMLYKALKFPLIRPCKSLYRILDAESCPYIWIMAYAQLLLWSIYELLINIFIPIC